MREPTVPGGTSFASWQSVQFTDHLPTPVAFELAYLSGAIFRAEFFNVFNHTNFNLPNRPVDIAAGGVISAAREPRLVQFGLKLLF